MAGWQGGAILTASLPVGRCRIDVLHPPPPSADDCFRIARWCLERQRTAEASRWLGLCLNLDPSHGAAWHLLGSSQFLSGQEEEALSSQRRSCQLHPQLGWNWFAAGELLERRGDWEGAAHHLRQAARWLPGETWIVERAALAAERAVLRGERLEDGLGAHSYRHWCRRLEPPLSPGEVTLEHHWWLPRGGGRWQLIPDVGSRALPGPCRHSGDWPADDGWLLLTAIDAQLRRGALAALENSLRLSGGADLLYPDEDRLDSQLQRCEPWFKPDWVVESFWSTPWLEAMSAWRIGWLRNQSLPPPPDDADGRWSWVLEALERNPRVEHVPRILVHRTGAPGTHGESKRQQRANSLRQHLLRLGERVASVRPSPEHTDGFELRWSLPDPVPRVRVVISTRDRPDLLDSCLHSLDNTRGRITPSIVVIDHDSRETSTVMTLQDWRRKLGRRLQVLRVEAPFNWSRLNNLGASGAEEEILLFLNDDVVALETGWLETMAAQAIRPAIGCVGAVLLYPDGRLQHAGMTLGFERSPVHVYRGLREHHSVHRTRSRFLSGWPAVTGACLMVRRDLFDAVEGFDEAFPVEGNDVAFCLTLLRQGLRHVVEPSARMIHLECQSRDPVNSPTQALALERLRMLFPEDMANAGPWWPAACSTRFTDGRPHELECPGAVTTDRHPGGIQPG